MEKTINVRTDSEIIERLIDDVYIGSTIWEKRYSKTGNCISYQNTYYIKNDKNKNIFVEYNIYHFKNRNSSSLSITLLKDKKRVFMKSIIREDVFELIKSIENFENYYEV